MGLGGWVYCTQPYRQSHAHFAEREQEVGESQHTATLTATITATLTATLTPTLTATLTHTQDLEPT